MNYHGVILRNSESYIFCRSSCKQNPSGCSAVVLGAFRDEVMKLLQNAVVANTANVYENAVSIFQNDVIIAWPPTMSDLIIFLALLTESNYSSCTATL